MIRNPMKDHVAIAGAFTTGFTARNTARSPLSYASEAGIGVLRACGLTASDVDGICGSAVPPAWRVQSALGIPAVTWHANPLPTFLNHLSEAASAVFSGMCEVVLVYHVAYRMAWNTASALKDPFRRGLGYAGVTASAPEDVSGPVGYSAWASRYVHEYGVPREHLGYVAVNGRSNATRNPAAGLRDPISMQDYLAARMIRSPLCLLDMDLPVDGADALVVTTAERARDLPLRPVLVHAIGHGMVDRNEEDQLPSLRHHGQHVAVAALRARSDFWIDDVDVVLPYDGFTVIALNWIENLGWCGPGEGGPFVERHWDETEGRILVDGRIPVNPHGGALSEGATQGSGHVREAVHQLQGLAGARQVAGARRALVTTGGFFVNAQGVTLHTA